MGSKMIAGVVAGIAMAGGVGLASAGTASADSTCTRTAASLVCTSDNGSFAGSYSPNGDFSVVGTVKDAGAVNPAVRAHVDRNGDELSAGVSLNATSRSVGVEANADLGDRTWGVVATGRETVTTVTDTVGDGNLPTVTRTPVANQPSTPVVKPQL